MNIGLTIREIRTRKGLKQGEVARMCNVTQTHLSLIEKGKKNPSSELISKLGDALDIPAPILSFLSFDIDDVKPEKKDAFRKIVPIVKAMLTPLFSDE